MRILNLYEKKHLFAIFLDMEKNFMLTYYRKKEEVDEFCFTSGRTL